MLLHVPDVLTADQVEDLRRRLDATQWVEGRPAAGEQGARTRRNRQLDPLSPVSQELGRVILKAVLANPLYMSAVLPLRHVPPVFSRDEGGEQRGLRVDGAMRAVPGTSSQLRSDLSCTLFLADHTEYEGGHLEVVDIHGPREVKLPAGDLVVHSSGSRHRMHPVTGGVRVAASFWVQSLVRDAGQRQMLFDLDQNIQSLRAQVGDIPAVAGLAGHYHNLVRAWSEV